MDGPASLQGQRPLWHSGATLHDPVATKTLGFWLYMISDALIFAGLFAAYAVLDQRMNMAGGPTDAQIMHPVGAFWQTLAVFGSVYAYSLATVALKYRAKGAMIAGMAVAFALGLVFLGLEIRDFLDLIAQGAAWTRSGFLAAFWLLIATHGAHMAVGLLWMAVMMVQVMVLGITTDVVTRLLNLRLFWQFQAAVWVCVYVFVYLRGGIGL
jgi:cytochrome o ubiquinol oxidase subunit 3